MPQSYVQYPANGSNRSFAVPFLYINKTHVRAKVDGVPVTFTWSNASFIQLDATPAAGTVVEVRRTTPNDVRVVDFVDGSTLTESDLDQSNQQFLYLSQEAQDRADEAPRLTAQNTYDFQGRRATNLADPVNAQDAVTRAWAETDVNSSVARSRVNADEAGNKATQAGTSADNAAASATAAKTAQTAAEYAASHPDLSTSLLKTQNLNDVPNKVAARSNLGLKGAAVLEVGQTAGTVAAGDDPRFASSGATPNAIVKGNNVAPAPNWATYNTPKQAVHISVAPLPVECIAGGGSYGTVDTILGTVDIPYANGQTGAIHSTGISGIARTADRQQGAVGVFGAAMPAQTGPVGDTLQVFGANFVVTNKNNLVPSVPNQGRSNCEIYGIEIDVACEKLPNGSSPTNTHIRGTWTTGNCEVQPDGALIGHYVGYAGAFTQVPWKQAFRCMDGAAETSLMAGFQPGNGAVGSAPIILRSRDGGGTAREGRISTDAGGNIVLAPGGGGQVTFADGGWIAYSPTIGSASGSPASAATAGKFKGRGKTVYFCARVVINSNGGASGYITLGLPAMPVTGSINVIVAGRNETNGTMLQGVIGETGSSVKILNFNNTYPGADGTILDISGTYEAA